MLITIDRELYNGLGTEKLKEKYVYSSIISNNKVVEILTESELEEVSYGINKVVSNNEKLIKKVGFKKYIESDYSAKDEVSGYFHRTGTIVVCPFDWTLNDEEKEEFDYSFLLARIL